MIRDADTLDQVLSEFDSWLNQHLINEGKTFAFVTDGPWDFKSFLLKETKRKDIPIEHYFNSWVDIRQHFGTFYGIRRRNITRMLHHMDMDFEGRAHSGIDDARNIARIAVRLIEDGLRITINDHMYKDR
eukprot:TRINITY_DN8918_c0_g1_i3.p1 TRINITY_DN8918_c0_g1~~TRINITY_DN8918_c0_g1_i3.p1  ORF type:complete len:130 (-),score=24.30 TRINITY_DN8918_c0_g1_i3:16-405(-)